MDRKSKFLFSHGPGTLAKIRYRQPPRTLGNPSRTDITFPPSTTDSDMAEQGTTNYADLVQTTAPGQKIRDLVDSLTNYVNVDAIAKKEGCSKVECQSDGSKILKEVWTEFMEEAKMVSDGLCNKGMRRLADTLQIPDVIEAVVPGGNSLSTGVRLLVFQAGWSSFYDLVDKDDCIVLIPVVISGSAAGTLYDYTSQRQMAITLETKSELLIAGRCAMWVGPQSKVVCVVLCIGKGNRGKDNKGEGKG